MRKTYQLALCALAEFIFDDDLCCTIFFRYSVTSNTNFENSQLKNQKKLLTTCGAFSIALL